MPILRATASRGALVVAGQHDDFQTAPVQFARLRRGRRLDGIGHGQDAGERAD